MAQVTIDGRAMDFSPGETVIQTATRQSLEIPHYCWHPRLSIAANCRMCLVEVEKAPKLVPACQTECRDGMVVHTQNAKVKAAQRAVHEFLLVNHPIDCPICDQAGECKLQDYYMRFQLTPSRMRDPKVHKNKLTRLGPHVVYNAERCIVCTRCVRFMDEIAHARQLGVFARGDHSVIGTFPGQPLDSPYSLNTVDVCPVGALTSTAFRFKQRVWNLRRSPSICPGCARGCNVHVDQRAGQVYRMLPRENEAVNKSWLCDEGRLTYARANDDRLTEALARAAAGAGTAQPLAAEAALARAVAGLQAAAKGAAGLVVSLSMHATNEDAFVLGRLAREALGCTQVALLGHADGAADTLLRVADKNPNRGGIQTVLRELGLTVMDRAALQQALAGGVGAWLAVGHEAADVAALAAAAAGVPHVVHVAHAHSPLSAAAHVTLPSVAWVQMDGTWLNAERRLQRLSPAYPPGGAARPAYGWLQALADGIGTPIAYPSLASLQADMQARLQSFAAVSLSQLPPAGAALA